MALAWFVFFGLLAASGAWSQSLVPLIAFDQVWRYESSGLDLGTAWREPEFDDSTWPSGPGLLAGGEDRAYPFPFNTALEAPEGRITDYFRTSFEWKGTNVPPGVVFSATAFLDDGCVVYLNGVDVGRLRMGPGSPNYLTGALVQPAVEGQPDTLLLDSTPLRTGWNTLAVEVHQTSPTSTDVVWGLSLAASVPTPLVITHQPQGISNLVNQPFELSVSVSGGPVAYQWYRNNVAIFGASGPVYAGLGSPSQTGDYTVVMTNVTMAVTSVVARVAILPDRVGPRVQSAAAIFTNFIDVTFDEPIQTSVLTNFTLTHLRSGLRMPLLSVISVARVFRLRVGPENLIPFDPYLLTISGVKDSFGNVVAPDTRIGVGWRTNQVVVPFDQVWSYHNTGHQDGGIYSQNWEATNHVEGSAWARGAGMFYDFATMMAPCIGTLNIDLGHQFQPYLFRTTFVAPPGAGASATLQFWHLLDDGAVFYLNGREIYRTNAPAGSVTALTRARSSVPTAFCVTNVAVGVSNLLPGTNWLAVALLQANDADNDAIFGLRVVLDYLVIPPLPSEPEPVLTIQKSTGSPAGVTLQWSGSGYALESSTNLESVLSYPLGSWLEVTNMRNPYPTLMDEVPLRAYRLKLR